MSEQIMSEQEQLEMNLGEANLGEAAIEPRYQAEPPVADQDANPLRNKIRNINIEQLDHGYIIRVDCHSFAFENSKKLMSSLKVYMDNPSETEKEWFDGKLFK